jgi:hypothetical protein
MRAHVVLVCGLGCAPQAEKDAPLRDIPLSEVPEHIGEATGAEKKAWRILVYMVGDNDLEAAVVHDLDELESGEPGPETEVLVLADRALGWDDSDGDWTETRLYRIEGDGKPNEVSSPILWEAGELDMADPRTLADFLAMGTELAPAERSMLVLWNHGTGWWADGTPPPGIGWDESSGTDLSVAEGELGRGLQAHTDAHGPIDIIAFDACNMAFFEVGLALEPHGEWMVAAQTTVGIPGLQYTPALETLRLAPETATETFAAQLATDPIEIAREWTFSATYLPAVVGLAEAVDELAGVALEDPAAMEALLEARDLANSPEPGDMYRLDYMDLGDLAATAAENPLLTAQASAVSEAVAMAVGHSQGGPGFGWASGLNIYANTSWLLWYRTGTPWANATRWDEFLGEAQARHR